MSYLLHDIAAELSWEEKDDDPHLRRCVTLYLFAVLSSIRFSPPFTEIVQSYDKHAYSNTRINGSIK